MFEIANLLVLIPALPLAAAILTALLGKHVLGRQSHLLAVVAIALSCAASVLLVLKVQDAAKAAAEQPGHVGYSKIITLWSWADVEGAYQQDGSAADKADQPEAAATRDFRIDVTLRADPLTAFMLVTVTLISLLVAVYSIGYMHGEPGYWRFFSYIALFVFSMTMLVSASNFVLLYVFWEAVGLCSYLLIGFWYQKPEAAAAGKKAFLVNRVGDFGFALGVFLIWTTYGTLNFHDTAGVPGALGQLRLGGSEVFVGGATATAICLLLMLGACGKSAQFPLHVWLPDAMEGPTPVSALIHAATMVTAGVYMVARCTPLFLASEHALPVVAVIGGFTALLAAAIALTQTDLKRILAYSTISQLGYMFLGLGAATLVGATAGMFHLFTHAFFKALLFLGAGSVMHAMGGVIDIRRFGGLRRLMPWTYVTFGIGCLALAGVPGLAGFFSKDQVLAALHAQGGLLYQVLFWAAAFTALLTAFYTFRAFFLTFHGQEKVPPEAGHHAHESPASMIVPLVILAAGSVGVGYLSKWVFAFLELTPSLAYHGLHGHAAGVEHGGHSVLVIVVSVAVVLAGIAAAWLLYVARRDLVEPLAEAMDSVRLYRLSHGKFFFDEIYDLLIVGPLGQLARLSYWVDQYLIDGLVNACGMLPKAVGAMLRPLQSGMVQSYALVMVLGLLVLMMMIWI